MSAAGSDVTIASEMPDRPTDYDCVVVMETGGHEGEVTSTTAGDTQHWARDTGSSTSVSHTPAPDDTPAAMESVAMDYAMLDTSLQTSDSGAFNPKLLQNLASRFAKLRGQSHLLEPQHVSDSSPEDHAPPRADLGNVAGEFKQPASASDKVKVKAGTPKKLKSRRQRDESSVLVQSRSTGSETCSESHDTTSSAVTKKARVKKDPDVAKVIRNYFDVDTSSDVSLTQNSRTRNKSPATTAGQGHTRVNVKPIGAMVVLSSDSEEH